MAVLLGGGTTKAKFVEDYTSILTRLEAKNILVVPYAKGTSGEKLDEIKTRFRTLCEQLDIVVNFIDEVNLHGFEYEALVINGGDPIALLQGIKQQEGIADLILEAANNGSLIVESAGAKVLAEYMWNRTIDGSFEIVKGMGLLPGKMIMPHIGNKHYDEMIPEIKAEIALYEEKYDIEIELVGIEESIFVEIDRPQMMDHVIKNNSDLEVL